MIVLRAVVFLFIVCGLTLLQKAATPPAENPGANTASVGPDVLTDPAAIIKDRPVSAL